MKIGIDIGGSHIASGIVEKNGELLDKIAKDLDKIVIKDLNQVEKEKLVIDTIHYEIDELLKRNDYTIGDITKIGIAVPGSIKKDGIINRLVNLHIENFDLVSILKEKYNTDIKIKNDAKCAGMAEKKLGALRRYENCVFLCIGTGVGSAVFLDDALLEVKERTGFELGHMVIEKNGTTCNCGRKGCYETYASMKRFKQAVIKEFKLSEDIKSEEIQRYIRENLEEDKVNKFINNYLDNINTGICNIIEIFEPEAICFGGSFSYYGDIFLPILEGKIEQELKIEKKLKLLTAKLKNDAGIIGASLI